MWMACGILSMLAITKLSAQQAPTTGYAPVNGLRMYYEVHGRGEPVVLLHGAFMPITVRVVNDRDYAAWLEQAKKKFADKPSAEDGIAVAAKDAPNAQ